MMLKEILEEYKSLSLELIIEIKEEANTEEIMEKRQLLLNRVAEVNLAKEEKKKICEEVNVFEVEKLVKEAIEEEQRKVKEEMKNIRIKKQANKGYGANINAMNFFNRKV